MKANFTKKALSSRSHIIQNMSLQTDLLTNATFNCSLKNCASHLKEEKFDISTAENMEKLSDDRTITLAYLVIVLRIWNALRKLQELDYIAARAYPQSGEWDSSQSET